MGMTVEQIPKYARKSKKCIGSMITGQYKTQPDRADRGGLIF